MRAGAEVSEARRRGFGRRRTDRIGLVHRAEMLGSPGWAKALAQFAQATGLAVTLFDADGELHAGPFTPTPLAKQLAAAGGWDQATGLCFRTDASAALDCVAENEIVQRDGLDALALAAVPVCLEEQPIGAIVAGWVFDHFPDPVATDRLAKTLDIPFTELWQTVRQQPPVSREKLSTYAALLKTLADSFLRERAEALQQQEQSHELRVLNESGQRLAAADSVEEIGAAVVEAAATLARARCVRLLVAGEDGEWHTVAAHGLAEVPGAEAAETRKTRRGVTSGLRVPVEASDGKLLAEIDLETDDSQVFDRRAHLSGLAGQAAVALQKVRAVAAIERQRATLERANRIKDEFLSVLSHELRTPLTPILGWATMLRQKLAPGELSETLDAGLAAIERNARQELHLVDEMLDLSRILNDKIHLEPELVDPKDALASAFSFARTLAEPHGQRIEMDVSQSLPFVNVDPRRLQQILSNLISNAVKFTSDGGSIALAARDGDGQTVEFVVSDTGQGINPKFLPHIFERFRQGDQSTTRRFGGLGIGLSIVRGLVELHGGHVRVESDGEGRGSTFVVSFPAAEPPPRRKEDAGAPHEIEAAADREPARGGSVLLVDDSPDTLEVLKLMIERAGYEVRTAGNAAAALEAARRATPDCVVTDIGMPEADGFDLLRELRADERLARVPVIALTGYATQLDREEVLGAGFSAHLPKPVEPSALAAALDRVSAAAASEADTLDTDVDPPSASAKNLWRPNK